MPDEMNGPNDRGEGRVRELRDRIAAGDYRVDPELVAEAIIRHEVARVRAYERMARTIAMDGGAGAE